MSQGAIKTWQGKTIKPKHYFGGNKRYSVLVLQDKCVVKDQVYLQQLASKLSLGFKTSPGPNPWSYGPHL